MFRRLQDAVSDVAETLRRTFGGVKVRARDPRFLVSGLSGFEAMKVDVQSGLEFLCAPTGTHGWRLEAAIQTPDMTFQARLEKETGWEAWESGSHAVLVPLFWPGKAAKLEVPALPRRASSQRRMVEPFKLSLRNYREPLRSPGTRQAEVRTPTPASHRDLARVLRRPFSFLGQTFTSLPRALQMRYTVQLVKSTGENIRDLEVVGLFRVPRKGLGGLRLDPRNGGLQATLTAEAVGAPKDLLLLAKRKADQALLPCFLEAN